MEMMLDAGGTPPPPSSSSTNSSSTTAPPPPRSTTPPIHHAAGSAAIVTPNGTSPLSSPPGATPSLGRGPPPETLFPPPYFAQVETGVYRSGTIEQKHFAFVSSELQLKSIVFLSPEAPLRPVRRFCEEHGVEMVFVGLKTWSPEPGWKPVNDELAKEALEAVLDRNNHPVLVTGTSGVHETGAIIGCLRRLLGWSLTAAMDEYRRMGGPRALMQHEQFIESFDTDLVTLPAAQPDWLVLYLEMAEQDRRERLRIAAEVEANGGRLTEEHQALPAYRAAHLLPRKLNRLRWQLVSERVTYSSKKSLAPPDD